MRNWLTLALMMLSLSALAAPKAELWPYWQSHDDSNAAHIDHQAWTAFLAQYLDVRSQPHRLTYAKVTVADKGRLDAYVTALQAVIPQKYARAEQKAYWVNLYNAATVQIVLQHYPVKSITKIKSGFFSFGPWDKKLLQVDGQDLSLNDIEHRILRPIFQDPRLHYALNCASLGCPSLASKAYTAQSLEAMLDAAAVAFINSPAGVEISGDRLVVSSIYDWFVADFGASQTGVIKHLRRYAQGERSAALSRLNSIQGYQYDWSLNDRK